MLGARRARTEDRIQAGIATYLGVVLPFGSVVYAIPNAARRTSSGRAGNAVSGLLPGMPDLGAVVAPGGGEFFLEVKSPTGKLSAAQVDVIARLRQAGARVAVVTGIDDVREALATWGIKTREAARAA